MTPTPKRLGLWLDGERVADIDRRGSGITLRYTRSALDRWPTNSPIISCSLPLGRRPLPAGPFLSGLLPEGRALQELAHRAGVSTADTFGLLARYGRDVAGALIISADEPEPRRHSVAPYDDDALRDAVDGLDVEPLGVSDDSELSLAGLQDKLLLVRLASGQWGRPQHGHPSTHILKRDDVRFPGIVAAEAAALRLALALGLTTVEAHTTEIAGHHCLIVSRFDRETLTDGRIGRIHQEDLCQAMGIAPALARGRVKYQDAGGPSLRDLATLVDRYAVDGISELEALVRVVTFTVLIGNADAHGKNLALLRDSATSVRLAPLYDTVPTALWPNLRDRAAMTIGTKMQLSEVTVADIASEARTWPYPPHRARVVVRECIERAETVLSDGLLDDAPDLAAYIHQRAASLRTT